MNFYNKKRIIALALTGSFVLTMAGCTSSETKVTPTPIPTNTTQPIDPTPTPTATPEVVEEANALTAENFDEKIEFILASNHEKGLDTRDDLVRSSLLLVNLDVLSKEDLVELGIKELNMQDELQNLLRYVSVVENHNLTNPIENHISFASLTYDELDSQMIGELDTQCLDVETITRDSYDEKKQDKVAEILTYVEQFIVGDGDLSVEMGDFAKQNVSSGAGILTESYAQVIGDRISKTKYRTGSMQEQIDTINRITTGLSYINDIYNSNKIAECIEMGNNTNTK